MFNLDRKNMSHLLIAGAIAVMSVGCSKKEEPEMTLVETMQLTDSFDLLNDESKVIITTENALGEQEISFAHRESLDCLINPNYKKEFKDSEYYDRYFQSDISCSCTFLYFDAFNGDLLSVQYVDKDSHIFKEDNLEVSYKISELIDSDIAYNYAVLYYGDKDKYSREEMQELIQKVRSDQAEKVYTK